LWKYVENVVREFPNSKSVQMLRSREAHCYQKNWFQKQGTKKGALSGPLLGRQRAGNHPSPRSVNNLGSKHKDGEGIEKEKAESGGEGAEGNDKGPAHNGH